MDLPLWQQDPYLDSEEFAIEFAELERRQRFLDGVSQTVQSQAADGARPLDRSTFGSPATPGAQLAPGRSAFVRKPPQMNGSLLISRGGGPKPMSSFDDPLEEVDEDMPSTSGGATKARRDFVSPVVAPPATNGTRHARTEPEARPERRTSAPSACCTTPQAHAPAAWPRATPSFLQPQAQPSQPAAVPSGTRAFARPSFLEPQVRPSQPADVPLASRELARSTPAPAAHGALSFFSQAPVAWGSDAGAHALAPPERRAGADTFMPRANDWGACTFDDDEDGEGGDEGLLPESTTDEGRRDGAPMEIDLTLDEPLHEPTPLAPPPATGTAPELHAFPPPQVAPLHLPPPPPPPPRPVAAAAPRSGPQAPLAVAIADGVYLPRRLADRLRPHQREGVTFMHGAISRSGDPDERGCILADVPGLGKSVQIIGTIIACRAWLRKAVLVVPVALVDNWLAEFSKWAPDVHPTKLAGRNAGRVLSAFTQYHGPDLRVLLVNYEKLRGHVQQALMSAGVHLVVCDEAHRLKNPQTLEFKAVRAISQRAARILVTGTPVQNSALEFYAMVNLTLPGALGTLGHFRRLYEGPMASGDMSEEVLGALSKETGAFMLRRSEAMLRTWLPARLELVVFCRLTEQQQRTYCSVIAQHAANRLKAAPASVLKLVGRLQKAAIHPQLVSIDGESDALADGGGAELADDRVGLARGGALPAEIDLQLGSKLRFVRTLLRAIATRTDEKVLLASSSVTALNLVARLADEERWPTVRIDGQVDQSKRKAIVDTFNYESRSRAFLFLLSSRAGGTGLNIVGASRLVLLDPDWNPATDAQVCGRIWRIGQERPVVIYRLIATSTIDELILQRQIAKGEISGMLVENNGGRVERAWSEEELAFAVSYDPASWSKIFSERGARQCLRSGDPVLDGAQPAEMSHVHVVGIDGVLDPAAAAESPAVVPSVPAVAKGRTKSRPITIDDDFDPAASDDEDEGDFAQAGDERGDPRQLDALIGEARHLADDGVAMDDKIIIVDDHVSCAAAVDLT